VHLWVHLISATKCISQHAQSQLARAFLGSLNLLVSKCISKLAQSQSPSASPHVLDHGLPVRLQVAIAVVSRYTGHGGGQSDREYVIGRP
jgi:hypothetical protein